MSLRSRAVRQRGAIGRRADVAFAAVQHLTNHRASTFRDRNPRTVDPRRIVANVLVMTAVEFSNPMLFVVLVKANDSLLHRCERVA